MNELTKTKAQELFENGELSELYALIKAYIDQKDPYAIYLYSCFSLDEWGESEEEFEERSLCNLHFAAENNVPEALYKLACHYLNGDIVEKSLPKSANYFECAAKSGHSRSKLSHGMNLYHGWDGIQQNRVLGLQFIAEAANEGVDGAEAMYSKLKH